MGFGGVIAIAFGLAMDAFAVSIASGVAMRDLKVRQAFRIAFFFGLFQAVMPAVGWLSGRSIVDFVSSFDHWVAFALLSIVGLKMIYEAMRIGKSEKANLNLGTATLLLLSVATSIDALIVGFGFAFLGVPILTPIIIIGSVTFAMSLLGVLIGDRVGHFFEKRIEVLGGLILIVMGLKILIEHLVVKP